MATAVIVDAVRTPGGKRNGKLRNWHAVDLASESLKALQARNDLDPALVDDVVCGCVMQVGEQSLNIGRNAVLAAGWPESVPATTVDRQCGSSQQSMHFAAQGVIAGAYDVVVAMGVEGMTRTPMGSSIVRELGFPFGPRVMARYAPVGGLVSQGIGAEMIADQWGISREELDAFGLQSHQRAARATKEGRFDNELVAHRGPRRRGQRHRRAHDHRRGHPRGQLARDARQAQARLQGGRQGHRRQLLADHRRLLGGAHHERGARRRSSATRRVRGSSRSRSRASTPSRCSPARSPPRPRCSSAPGSRWTTSTSSRSTRRSPRSCSPGRRSTSPTWSA